MWDECDTTIQHIRHAWTVINGIISPSYILKDSRLRARMSIVVSCRAELVTFVVPHPPGPVLSIIGDSEPALGRLSGLFTYNHPFKCDAYREDRGLRNCCELRSLIVRF